MNGYNFTDRVRKVLQMAREEAARLHHEYVGTEHILLGLIREGEGVAAAVLTNLNVDLEEIQQKIEETVKKGKAAAAAGPDLPYTSRAKKVLELAMTEARELNHSYVGHRAPAARPLARGEGHRRAGADRRRASTWSSRGRRRCGCWAATCRSRSSSSSGGASPPGRGPQVREEIQDSRARPLLPRSDPARRRRPARSDHRAGQGDRAGHGDPGPPQEEQPGADRRARRRARPPSSRVWRC